MTNVLHAGAVPVEVTRKRVRNLNLRVRRDGSVAMSIPVRTSLATAQRFLDEREAWVAEQVARVRAGAQRATNEDEPLVAGSVIPLWGAGHVVTGAEAGLSSGELYRREMADALPSVVARFELLVGAHATGWSLRSMRTRWGSCTVATGRIRINTQLAANPPACLEYVVVHELTHLLESGHTPRFHQLVARVVPNEAEIRSRLRKGPLG